MKRNGIISAIIIVIIGATIYQNWSSRQERAAALQESSLPKPGHAAPALELNNLEGQLIKVGGKRDKPLVLNYWASWCLPCQAELPDLQWLHEQYGDQLDIYGVNATIHDELKLVQAKVKEFGLQFPIIMDPEGVGLDLYKVGAIPMTYLIDRNGMIVEVLYILHKDELERRVKELIKL
ncbi:MAG: TlpA family protein disulfide reductase [Paenibacillus sp.]|nr:TlpA family protein disulfide reductase [Paenibacillus sp.]